MGGHYVIRSQAGDALLQISAAAATATGTAAGIASLLSLSGGAAANAAAIAHPAQSLQEFY
jgi:hypothetical protein